MPVLCNLSTCSNQDYPYLNGCLSKICFIGDCVLESYKKSKLQKHISKNKYSNLTSTSGGVLSASSGVASATSSNLLQLIEKEAYSVVPATTT